MKKHLLMTAAALLSLAVHTVSAQTSQPTKVTFHWGMVHMNPGEAYALNFASWDPSLPQPVAVEFKLTDSTGRVLYDSEAAVLAGHTFTFMLVPSAMATTRPPATDIRTLLSPDLVATLGPEIRTIIPCVKVIYPSGVSAPILDRGAVTLEMFDMTTGKQIGFATTPQAANVR